MCVCVYVCVCMCVCVCQVRCLEGAVEDHQCCSFFRPTQSKGFCLSLKPCFVFEVCCESPHKRPFGTCSKIAPRKVILQKVPQRPKPRKFIVTKKQRKHHSGGRPESSEKITEK